MPDLLPRGRGEATTLLMVANATGRQIVTEGAGAQPVDLRRLAADPDLPTPTEMPVEGYSVVKEQWRLAVRLEGEVDASQEESQRTRVELAEVSLTRGADGRFWGQAEYHLGPRPGAFLQVTLPGDAEPLSASVNGRVTRVLRTADACVLIPLGGEGAPPGRRSCGEVSQGNCRCLNVVRRCRWWSVCMPSGRNGPGCPARGSRRSALSG